MIQLDEITRQVLKNCDISDSAHAGLFSICGLALRLRDLYKWEQGLEPWIERDHHEVLEWIGRQEEKWSRIGETEYVPLAIQGKDYDPFDTPGINHALIPEGLFYGAGYARSLKPTFFLAKIDDTIRIEDIQVLTLGEELARDLLNLPALSQDGKVILRKSSAKYFLWDQMVYVKKSGRSAFEFALKECRLRESTPTYLKNHLDLILDFQKQTYIYHEIGEMKDEVFDPAIWREIIAHFPHSPIELLVRSVKDLLADTSEHGTLKHIIGLENTVSLGLYAAFFDGLARELFPELRQSFERFVRHRDWAIMERARTQGFTRARACADSIMNIFREGKQEDDMDRAGKRLEKLLP